MQNHIGHLIRILHWCTDQTITASLEQMDLTASQGRILGYLSHQPSPPCPKDIEEAFHLSHPTVSGILSRMEQKGFIALRPDPGDRRCKRIHILPRGMECHQTIYATILTHEEHLVQGFTPEEKALFTDFLQRAAANMGVSPCHPNPKEDQHP